MKILPSPEQPVLSYIEGSRRAKILTTFYLLLATFFLSAFLFANPTLAAISSGGLKEFQESVKSNEYNKESFDAQSAIGLFNSISTGIIGCVSENPDTCPKTEPLARGGVVNIMASAIGTMYSVPPASGVTYFADIGNRLNLVQPAYAQSNPLNRAGTGMVLNLWRGFRNAAYILFVVLFVAVGFAIMFRMNLSPQVTITIQSAIPRVIISLILVTFSFAIVGLLLDLAHVSVGLVDATLNGVTHQANWFQELINITVNAVSPGVIGALIGGIIGGFGGILGGIGGIALGAAGGATAGFIIGTSLFILIVAVLFVFAVFRILIMFIQAYVGILLQTILAPLIIIFNTLPGKSLFWGWFGGLLANVSVFVISYAVLQLGWLLMKSISTVSSIPFLGGGTTGPDVPLPGVLSTHGPLLGLLTSFVGLGILLMLPNIVNAMKEAINRATQYGEPSGFGLVKGGIERAGAPKVAQLGGEALQTASRAVWKRFVP